MMETLLRNAEGNLAPIDRDYAAKKLGRLDRYFRHANRVEIVHREEKLGHKIEVTVYADGLTLRGEERDASVRAAIDLVAEKLESRLRKVKGRLANEQKRRGVRELPDDVDLDDGEPEFEGMKITQRKSFVLKPMSLEEALLQMELLGHPFFVFTNQDTRQTEVVYRRSNGTAGHLSPRA
jgi:putative sigma-54 modulation protein